MVAVLKQSQASNVHKLTPPQKAAVERNLDADERALLKAEKSGAFAHGALMAIPALLLGAWLGWAAYDQSVARTADQLNDMTVKGAIARSIAEEASR